jgi:hypothetical protein
LKRPAVVGRDPTTTPGTKIVEVVVEVEVLAVDVVLELLPTTQLGPLPGAGQASQQLVQVPAVPCFAAQCAASFSILHFGPFGVVRQQVTEPGLPQVERAAHFFTAPLQLLGRLGLVPLDSVLATPTTHFT